MCGLVLTFYGAVAIWMMFGFLIFIFGSGMIFMIGMNVFVTPSSPSYLIFVILAVSLVVGVLIAWFGIKLGKD